MHWVGVPLHKYIKRVYGYVYVHIFNVCVYATRAFVGLERVSNRKERYMLEEYILIKIYLSSTEVLFQKMH